MKKILITGGAGFIGMNAAEHFINQGWHVTIFDNLFRKGTEINLKHLEDTHPGKFKFIKADVSVDRNALEQEAKDAEVILHLAGQVGVATSVANPREDFEINALGTLNVLEAARLAGHNPLVIYASTNKVYGKLEKVKIIQNDKRYDFAELPEGVDEEMPVDFHSPYGCSKGTGDQYVRDYARIYGLPTVVFRQSCIYGTNQFGVEDQGWVAWFSIAGLLKRPVTLFGDGKQVRDILYISDLVAAYQLAIDNPKKAAGQIYNIGGGPGMTLSLLELIDSLEKKWGIKLDYKFGQWRPGDQPIYVSNIQKIEKELGWKPKINIEKGVPLMIDWVKENLTAIERVFK